MKTTFTMTRNDKGHIEITTGRWTNVPEGQWCAYPKDFGSVYVKTAPHITPAQIYWVEFHITEDRLNIYEMKYRKKDYVFASDVDFWSTATHFGRRMSWSLDRHDLSNKNQFALHRVKKLKAEISDLILGVIETHWGLCAAKDQVEKVQAQAKTNRRAKSQESIEKARVTRKKTKAGGNPKIWKLGDIVCAVRPMKFQGGSVHTKFYFTTHQRHKSEGFYTEIDENGFGIGIRYKATKKDMVRICPTGLEMLSYLSMHDKMALMAEQTLIEEKRKQQEQKEKEDQTQDS